MTALETSSKYKVKGTAVIGATKFLRKHLGEVKCSEILRMSGLSNGGMILASSWYSFDNYHKLVDLAAEVMQIDDKSLIYLIGKFNLETDLNGVYKFFMRVSGFRTVLSKVPKLMSTYSNYLTASLLENREGHFIMELSILSQYFDRNVRGIEGGFEGMALTCKTELDSFEVSPINEEIKDGDLFINCTIEIKYSTK